MKKLILTPVYCLFACMLSMSALAAKAPSSAEGLNVIVTSGEPQTQMMAMVLSMMTLKQNKKVNMVLCSEAGSLAIKGTKSPVVKAMEASPKAILQKLIKKGMDVKLCPLYLPSINKDKTVLIKGVQEAEPMSVAKRLLDKNYHILSY